jgi:hypothetical protein
MSLLKVKTSGTTVYLVDVEGQRFKRHKGETSQSGPMWRDGEWNEYHNAATIEVGKSMLFFLNRPMGAWQKSSAVTAIEEVESEPDA